jgi:hypothetical protein
MENRKFKTEYLNRSTKLAVDTTYYLVIQFDLTAVRDNDGQSVLNVVLTFEDLEVMKGSIEDANTGKSEEMTFTDATTGKMGKTTTLSFRVPSSTVDAKTVSLLINLAPVTLGTSHLSLEFDYDGGEGYNLKGYVDGLTKNLTVSAVQIEAPVLTLTESNYLEWNHVKNAEYYMIYYYSDKTPVKDNNGNDVVVYPTGVSVGGNVTCLITDYLYDPYELCIRAFNSNSNNIIPSNYSNSVNFMG